MPAPRLLQPLLPSYVPCANSEGGEDSLVYTGSSFGVFFLSSKFRVRCDIGQPGQGSGWCLDSEEVLVRVLLWRKERQWAEAAGTDEESTCGH